ncbi:MULTISPECIES: winged helix-turn-helix domain-containing protein [unclassified Streptomyces]|uniref:winged helix-turn-helix domain-containing protein n=1 Tax=unclassified Streptomyces TaxID=2593676 RepID=UPI00278C28B0|nr:MULTISPECIES: winged helix-turn-helix domain-containing protein [unclassified Streptomyces]
MTDKIDPEGIDYHYVQLANIIERRIRTGTYAPGTRLPGEMKMAHDFGAGTITVRRALAILRDKGLTITVPARGTFVVRELPEPTAD